MRTGLPAAFVAELTRQGRMPRQLLEFYFAGTTVYVSDQEYGDALANAYLPLVENWGSLEDTSDLQAVIDGTASGTRQLSLTLINKRLAPFSALFTDESPENVRVKLYQWFEGTAETDKVLLDEFIIQDPIEFDEASNLLRLDLVSLIQYADPYIGQLSAADNNFYGIVIGAISNAAGTPYGTRPIVQLAGDIAAGATTITCTSSPATAGFPSSGVIVIDYECIQYTGISGNSFTGCTGGWLTPEWSKSMPHAGGQYVFKFNHEYLYSFGQGPLEVMGPVYLDGVEYGGQYNIYKDRNPAQVGFLNRDPFVKSTGTTTVTLNMDNFVMGNHGDSLTGGTWRNLTNAAIGSDDGTYAYLDWAYASSFQENTLLAWQYASQSAGVLSSISGFSELQSAKVIAFVHQDGSSLGVSMQDSFKARRKNITGATWDGFAGRTEGSSSSDITLEIDVTSRGWYGANTGYATMLSSICMSAKDFESPLYRNYCKLDLLRVEIKYKPHVTVHSTNVTCNLYSGTGNTNPADAIKMVLSRVGIVSAIDAASFAAAKTWFTSNGYQFNGWLAGDLRCREVLAAMCQQSRSRLVYTGGKIKLLVREHVSDKTVDQGYTENTTRAKSISVSRQSVQDILNKITVRYNATALDTYGLSLVVSNTASVIKYGLHEAVWDFFLVETTAMATALANFYLAELATPVTYLTFQTYLPAFVLEMDDTLAVYSEFGNLVMFKGDVGRIVREFGSAKTGSINLHAVTVIGRPVPAINLELEDDADPSDSFEDAGVMLNIEDTATPADELATGQETTDQNGYGQGGYGQGGYGD